MPHAAEYLGLFTAAFLAATILPVQSEVVLIGMLLSEHYQVWALLLVASVGNILGSALNWLFGRFLSDLEKRRWFPIKRQKLNLAERWYHRYGRWTLLLSWVPVIGDPLTIIAGVMREPFPAFLALVAVAKVARYLVVVALGVAL